jgi:uncharacterized protein YkwD
MFETMRSANAVPRILLIALLTLLLAACGGGSSGGGSVAGTGASTGTGTPNPTGPVDDDPLPGTSREEQVLVLVNQVRADYGLDPVEWHEGAAAVALAHSEDMALREFFAHENPDGLNPGDRLAAANVELSAWGENIAMGYLTPVHVMDGWMNSPGHRDNILTPGWTHLGIGITDPVEPGPYWTQNFLHVP